MYPIFDANKLVTKTNVYDVEEPYVSIIKDGSRAGYVEKRQGKSSVIGTMGYVIPNESDVNFIYAVMQSIDFSKYIKGTTIPHLYFKDYGDLNLYIPNIEEQRAIGFYFEKIDNLITLHQREVDQLKNMKKTLLKYMFV